MLKVSPGPPTQQSFSSSLCCLSWPGPGWKVHWPHSRQQQSPLPSIPSTQLRSSPARSDTSIQELHIISIEIALEHRQTCSSGFFVVVVAVYTLHNSFDECSIVKYLIILSYAQRYDLFVVEILSFVLRFPYVSFLCSCKNVKFKSNVICLWCGK